MRTRKLGRTSLEVSVVGFGGIPIQGLSEEQASKVLNLAVDLGINFFDTARGYTDSEVKIGKALSARRNQILLASKSMARTGVQMNEELETSLRNLKTDRIDLYQLHAVGSDEQLTQVLGPGGALEALSEARDAGKVRYIGVTGHVRRISKKALESDRFDTVQLPFNPIETDWLEDVVPAARATKAGIIGMKPVAGGAFNSLVSQTLRFSLLKGVDVVIPGMDSIEQVKQNAAVGAQSLDLSEEDIIAIGKEKERWSGHFCRRCGYCKPCPNGIEIPFLLLIESYYTRYGLTDWALERLDGLEKKYADCEACGVCEERCPYQLPIRELLGKAAKIVK